MLHCALDNWTPIGRYLWEAHLWDERHNHPTKGVPYPLTHCLVKSSAVWNISKRYFFLPYLRTLTYEIIFPCSLTPCWSNKSELVFFSHCCWPAFFFFFSKQTKKSITCTAPCEVFHTRNSASISLFYLSSQFFLLGTRLWPHKTVGCYWNDLNTVTIKRTSWISNWIASCKGFLRSER